MILKKGVLENEPAESIGLATIDCSELTGTLLQVLDYIPRVGIRQSDAYPSLDT
jgi:hypothetical protein